jgi:signal transduction histidine kinase
VANERRRLVATVLAVVTVTSGLVLGLRVGEGREERARLDATAEALAASIDRELERFAELGAAVNAAVDLLPEVDNASYQALLGGFDIAARYPSLLAVNRSELVPRSALPEVLARERRVEPGFELQTDGGGDELRLIVQVFPDDPANRRALGLDIAAFDDARLAHERAQRTRGPALSDVTQLVVLPEGEAGSVLYVPDVDDDGTVGAWAGLLFSGEVFVRQLAPLPAPVAVRVVDPAGSGAAPTVLGEVGRAPEGPARQAPLDRFGERWRIEVRPGPGFATPWWRRGSTLAGIGGLLIGGLLVLLVDTLSTRERRAQLLAERRTRELAAANEELGQLNRALRHANADKDQFLASVSHELRTPLTVIGGFSDSLRRMHDDPELVIFLDPIDRNVRRLDGLVSDLLALASLDAGAVDLFPEAVDLAALVQTPEELADLDPTQVRVEADDPVLIRADRRHVERVVTNLLTNATRHGRPPVEVRVVSDGGEAVLQVRDHGAGIDPAVAPKLFGRFVRGPDVDRATGTGLGLAIVRELTELNGGRAAVQPAYPGVRFEIRFPLLDPAAAVPAPQAPAGVRGGDDRTAGRGDGSGLAGR